MLKPQYSTAAWISPPVAEPLIPPMSAHAVLLWHCLLPGILTLAAFIAIRVWQLDEKWQGFFLTDRQWPYKDNFWLLNVIHNGGHKASLALYAGVFIYWLKGKINGAPAAGLAYVLSAVGLSVVLINVSTHFAFPLPLASA